MMEMSFLLIGFAMLLIAFDAKELIRVWKECDGKSKEELKNHKSVGETNGNSN